MDIKKTLEEQLVSIEKQISISGISERRAMLELAKSNVLLGLQKYEK